MQYTKKYRYEIRIYEDDRPLETGTIFFKELFNWAVGDDLLPPREVEETDEYYDPQELWARILVDNLKEGRDGYALLGSPQKEGVIRIGSYEYDLILTPLQ